LGSGLRAAGDVKFTMYISVFSTVFVRLALSYIFALTLNLGVMGIAIAMCCDWVFKGVVYFIRLRSGKWKNFKVV
jgi:Na+-driven multidrug efflux pump